MTDKLRELRTLCEDYLSKLPKYVEDGTPEFEKAAFALAAQCSVDLPCLLDELEDLKGVDQELDGKDATIRINKKAIDAWRKRAEAAEKDRDRILTEVVFCSGHLIQEICDMQSRDYSPNIIARLQSVDARLRALTESHDG